MHFYLMLENLKIMVGNWKSLKNSKPEANKLVELSNIPTGIGGTRWGWQSTGRLRKSGLFTIKYTDGYSHNLPPTHWRELEQ